MSNTQIKVDYLRSLPVQRCAIGMIINANPNSPLGAHIDAHKKDIEAHKKDIPRYLSELLALGETNA